MKKLAVFLMITALAMFMVPALASADGHGHGHGIKGQYAVTGYSTCNPASAGIFEADYTFNGDGTGSVTNGFVRSFTSLATAGFAHYTVDFIYEVTHEGRIKFTYPPCRGESGEYHASCGNHIVKKDAEDSLTLWEATWNLGPGHGVVSPDGKTITITCGPPVVLEVIESTNPGLPVGTKASCVTSGVGIRLH